MGLSRVSAFMRHQYIGEGFTGSSIHASWIVLWIEAMPSSGWVLAVGLVPGGFHPIFVFVLR